MIFLKDDSGKSCSLNKLFVRVFIGAKGDAPPALTSQASICGKRKLILILVFRVDC